MRGRPQLVHRSVARPEAVRLHPRQSRYFAQVEPINTKADLQNRALDLSIFWCDPSAEDMDVEVLFKSNTRPLASPEIAARAEALGLETAVREIPLLPDASGMAAWRDWHDIAGLTFAPKKNALSLPDANSRLQAVIAGNGLGMQDAFAEPEIESGHLVWISDLALTNFAYCISLPTKGNISAAAELFRDWIRAQDFWKPERMLPAVKPPSYSSVSNEVRCHQSSRRFNAQKERPVISRPTQCASCSWTYTKQLASRTPQVIQVVGPILPVWPTRV